MIKGIIDVQINYINKDFLLYNSNEDIDIYINNIKINDNKYKFDKIGKYKYQLIFKNKITNLNSFFSDCSQLISLDLSNFDTSKVIEMDYMFNKCHKLKEIKGINKFNTSNVTNMTTMFQQCNELISLDLSNFDTSKVNDMGFMFNHCYKLKEIKGINKFNASNVINMRTMFQACHELISLDLSNFDTSKVNDMSYMLYNCYKLEYLNILNFSIKNDCKIENIIICSILFHISNFFLKYKKGKIINKINSRCNFITNNTNLKNFK